MECIMRDSKIVNYISTSYIEPFLACMLCFPNSDLAFFFFSINYLALYT